MKSILLSGSLKNGGKYLFLLLLCLCSGLVVQAQNNNDATDPIDRNIARFQKQVSWIKAVARNEKHFPIDLIFVGDSITHRWEKQGKKIWDQYYGNRRAFNFGIGGDQTGHVIWRLENAPMEKVAPKMAVVMIGTNNPHKPVDTVKGIKKIVLILQEKYPEAKILLIEVFPRGKTANDSARKRINTINAILRKECAGMKNVQIRDLSSCFLDQDGNIPADRMPDFLHPEEIGYERWAKAIEPDIEKVLGPIPADPPECIGFPRAMERFKQKNEILKKGKINILMIGDSITHYWETSAPDVWNELFKNVNAINLGIGWDRTENVIWRLEHYDFSKIDPRAAFLLIGVNNNSTSDPVHIGKGNRRICQILHEKFPNMQIYLQKVFPWGKNDLIGKNDIRNAINQEIEKAVADLDYVKILDLSGCFLTDAGKLDTNAMSTDLVHLKKAGYQNWKKAIQPYVDKVRTLHP